MQMLSTVFASEEISKAISISTPQPMQEREEGILNYFLRFEFEWSVNEHDSCFPRSHRYRDSRMMGHHKIPKLSIDTIENLSNTGCPTVSVLTLLISRLYVNITKYHFNRLISDVREFI